MQGAFGPLQLPRAVGSSVPLLDALVGLRFVGYAPYYARLPSRPAPALITRSVPPGCPCLDSDTSNSGGDGGNGSRIEAPPGQTFGRLATEIACVDARSWALLRPGSCTFSWVGRTLDGRLLPAYGVRYTAPADAEQMGNPTVMLKREIYPYVEQSNVLWTKDVRPADGMGGDVHVIHYRPTS